MRGSKAQQGKVTLVKDSGTKGNYASGGNWPVGSMAIRNASSINSVENDLKNLVGALLGMAKPFLEDLIQEVISKQPVTQAQPEPEDELLSVKDTAAFFGVSEVTIHAWKRQGILKPIRRGRRVYFSKKSLWAQASA